MTTRTQTGQSTGLETSSRALLNIYFTAGFPRLEDTARIALALQAAGADLIEIGFPYSDPLADGPTIQHSSQVALENGITLDRIFSDLSEVREQIHIPVYGMLYYNQILQYGRERFLTACKKAGISGLIVPDLPVEYLQADFLELLNTYEVKLTLLISPETPEARMRQIEEHTTGFLYVVSSSATTGKSRSISDEQLAYFRRIRDMQFAKPTLIGFGIHDAHTFRTACAYANGAIIGSAFIRQLEKDDSDQSIHQFVHHIKS